MKPTALYCLLLLVLSVHSSNSMETGWELVEQRAAPTAQPPTHLSTQTALTQQPPSTPATPNASDNDNDDWAHVDNRKKTTPEANTLQTALLEKQPPTPPTTETPKFDPSKQDEEAPDDSTDGYTTADEDVVEPPLAAAVNILRRRSSESEQAQKNGNANKDTTEKLLDAVGQQPRVERKEVKKQKKKKCCPCCVL